MDAHVFLILLLLSLPLIKEYGDSLWIVLVPPVWALLVFAFDLSRAVTSVDVHFTEWPVALALLLGFRYRRYFGLDRALGWVHLAALFVFYAACVWINAVLVKSPESAEASSSDLGAMLFTVLGMAIVGFLPLALFWVYRRLTMPSTRKAT
jgi:hypothetical protein